MNVRPQEFIESIVNLDLATREQIQRYVDTLSPDRQQNTKELARTLQQTQLLTSLQAKNIAEGKADLLKVGEDYVLMEPLGKGGMGEVFKALHKTMAREVAIKFVALQVAKDAEALSRFQREVRAAAKLIHPNIVTAFDAGVDRKRPYLVMEFVAGRDLSKVLEKYPKIPVRQAVLWIQEAASGLACAHENGIVHRDIKPQNLLIDNKGHVKILDLGLARIASDIAQSRELTASGTVMGTADYMAPEQASDAKNVDHRVDIYSLGCTLYRILTGRAPFETDSMVNTLVAHRTKLTPSLKSARPDVPDALEQLYQKMMAKRPEDRIGSMKEVIEALQSLNTERVSTRGQAVDPKKKNPLADTQASPADTPTLEIDLASIDLNAVDLADSEASTLANIPTPGVTVVGYPTTPYWQTVAQSNQSHNNRRLIWMGSIAGVLVVGLLGILGYTIVQLSNRKTDTIVIKEQAPATEQPPTQEPTLPPLPDPFSDRAAAEWALALGGKVRVLEPNKESYDVWHPAGLPATEFRVEGISVDNLAAVTDTSISQVRELTALRDLSIANTAFTDNGLVYLKSLASLRTLNVQGCKLTDKALETLAQRTELQSLLASGNLTDTGLKNLHPLGKLTSASFNADGPTGVGLDSLVKFSPNLVTLLTENFKVNDNDVGSLKNLGNLRVLGLINAPLTDGCVDKLAELKNLTQLILQGTQVSAEGLQKLQAALPNCKIYGGTYNPRRNAIRKILMAGGKVIFSTVGFAPTQLNSFNELPENFIVHTINLEGVRPLQLDGMAVEEASELILTDSGIGLTDLRRIPKHFPLLTELKIDGTLISDSELVMFSLLKSLQLLDAKRTDVKENGASQLKRQLPNCEVEWGLPLPPTDRELAAFVLKNGGFVACTQKGKWLRLTDINELESFADGQLLSLELSGKNLDESFFRLLPGAPQLQSVALWSCTFDPMLLAYFGKCKKLQYPSLQGCSIDDRTMVFLKPLEIGTLNVNDTKVTSSGLILLGAQPRLSGIGMQSTTFYAQDAQRMNEQFPNLRSIGMSYIKLGTPELRTIQEFKNLRHVDLRGVQFDQPGMFQAILEWKQIEGINLSWTALDDSSLVKLSKLPNLKRIDCLGCKVTFDGYKRSTASRPDIEIIYSCARRSMERIVGHGGAVTVSIPGKEPLEVSKIADAPERDFELVKIDLTNWNEVGIAGGDYGALSEPSVSTVVEFNCPGKRIALQTNLDGFKNSKKLRICNLRDTKVTDDFLAPLLTCFALRELDLRGTKVSSAFIQQLKKVNPRCRVQSDLPNSK